MLYFFQISKAQAESEKCMNYLTQQEVADSLGVHYDTVGRWLRDGKIPGAQKIGGVWRIDQNIFEGYFDDRVSFEAAMQMVGITSPEEFNRLIAEVGMIPDFPRLRFPRLYVEQLSSYVKSRKNFAVSSTVEYSVEELITVTDAVGMMCITSKEVEELCKNGRLMWCLTQQGEFRLVHRSVEEAASFLEPLRRTKNNMPY